MLYETWLFAWLVGASLRDLQRGMVEDLFPAVIGVSGFAFHSYTGMMNGSWFPVLASAAVGVVCLLVGVYAVRLGFWGGADALLLGASGFAFPRFQLFLIAAVATTGVIYTYAWKYVTGERVARMVPVFPLALLGLHVFFP